MTTGSLVARKRDIQCKTKVKTGCATCRIRKVKCDENKPFCRKCVDTGRTCDGYESPFRISTSKLMKNAQVCDIKSGAGLQRTMTEVAPQDIELLNRYFSTKTMFEVKLGCDEEARQVLQASLTDSSIRHAVLSLRALRENFEISGDVPVSAVQHTTIYDYGLRQYCMALGGLASNLSSPGSAGLKSALLCCQVFISIEQVQGNYATLAQHIIRGLKVMHEYRARPVFVDAIRLVPAHHHQLPFIDVFVIKLFAAPCKFADPPETVAISKATVPVCMISPQQQLVKSRDLRTIAPDKRTELKRIAESTLEFLNKVSHVKSTRNALRLLSEKASLLEYLRSWLIDLDLSQKQIGPAGLEPIPVSFMRLFHQILKVVLLGALDSSPDLYAELRTENDRLQGVASYVGERVKGYRICRGTGKTRGVI